MAEINLSDEEKYFIIVGVAQDIRADGRARLDYRSKEIEANVITNAHGSIRIKLAETDVIIATKVELGSPDEDKPELGKLEFLVDCSPLASPEFEGRGGDQLSETICGILTSSYSTSGAIDMKSLCIVPEKFCYVINVDILVLQCGGNLLDVIAMGCKACLGICEIPVVTGLRFDLGEPTPVFTTDEYEFTYLDVREAPVVVTLPRVGRYFVIDATIEEESCSKGKLAIGVTSKGDITSIDKIGRCCYQLRSLAASIKLAAKVGQGLNKVLLEKIESIKSQKKQLINPDFPEGYIRRKTYKELVAGVDVKIVRVADVATVFAEEFPTATYSKPYLTEKLNQANFFSSDWTSGED
ncbi:unnamed protein product [Allacma fusca]|uniref:Exosome complex component RRP42 n=1 Tax=Allacma fusca TaxID=39272 RepID=A0A8J2P2G0_9HEXA|nr:unnamed protein product [Allacma fusca]